VLVVQVSYNCFLLPEFAFIIILMFFIKVFAVPITNTKPVMFTVHPLNFW